MLQVNTITTSLLSLPIQCSRLYTARSFPFLSVRKNSGHTNLNALSVSYNAFKFLSFFSFSNFSLFPLLLRENHSDWVPDGGTGGHSPEVPSAVSVPMEGPLRHWAPPHPQGLLRPWELPDSRTDRPGGQTSTCHCRQVRAGWNSFGVVASLMSWDMSSLLNVWLCLKSVLPTSY
jgi:hypothetical protein